MLGIVLSTMPYTIPGFAGQTEAIVGEVSHLGLRPSTGEARPDGGDRLQNYPARASALGCREGRAEGPPRASFSAFSTQDAGTGCSCGALSSSARGSSIPAPVRGLPPPGACFPAAKRPPRGPSSGRAPAAGCPAAPGAPPDSARPSARPRRLHPPVVSFPGDSTATAATLRVALLPGPRGAQAGV